MSLYSFVTFGAAAPIPAAGLDVVAGSQMSVRVEEDEMLLVLNFQGNLLGVTAAAVTLGFEVDGAAATALPLLAHTFLTGQLQLPVNISLPVTLTKGEHVIALTADDPGTAGITIDGGVADCRFSATRVSNAATLGQGVNSKVQLSL